MEFDDKALVCRVCGKTFLFTAGEQEFYRQKGLLNQPGRCHECRKERLAGLNPKAPAPVTSENTTPTEPPITSTVKEVTLINCAKCGKETTVPFRPRLSRPVYCASCFNEEKKAAALAVANPAGEGEV